MRITFEARLDTDKDSRTLSKLMSYCVDRGITLMYSDSGTGKLRFALEGKVSVLKDIIEHFKKVQSHEEAT